MQKNIIVTLILSIFIAVFALLNAASVQVNLIFTKVDVSAALIILISTSIGAIIVYSIDTISKMKSKKKIKENEKTILNLTNEIKTLKEMNNKYEGELLALKEKKEKIEKKQSEEA